jgi:hypothetical protein
MESIAIPPSLDVEMIEPYETKNVTAHRGWFVVFGCVFAALYSAPQKHNQTPQTHPA